MVKCVHVRHICLLAWGTDHDIPCLYSYHIHIYSLLAGTTTFPWRARLVARIIPPPRSAMSLLAIFGTAPDNPTVSPRSRSAHSHAHAIAHVISTQSI